MEYKPCCICNYMTNSHHVLLLVLLSFLYGVDQGLFRRLYGLVLQLSCITRIVVYKM